ncbi:MAG: 6-carboxytetrahydropterin synthase [Bacteroidales bacterium]|nr:6-carboxytetrahydropterin synthase [Bacteroidales bacterium]
MSKIRVTKEFTFEMAHALMGYDGACKFIHGHSYGLSVTVMGEPVSEENNPKLGMVIDFGDLKKIVKSNVVDVFDHALVLNSNTPKDSFNQSTELFKQVIFVDYQPTSENLVMDFAKRIQKDLPDNIKLFSLRLRETATSYAEWFASDN